MKINNFTDFSSRFNVLAFRERVLVVLLMISCVYFFWYMIWGLAVEKELNVAVKKREDLLSLSETIMSQYEKNSEKYSVSKNIAIIDKRISTVKSKMGLIDQSIHTFNKETIAIDEIVLLLRDVLSANDRLTLESLKVHPSEVIKRKNINSQKMDDAFEKNMISLKLKGDYVNVFNYLEKLESLKWSVFWQNVNYMVDVYPQAVVDIQLYTLSIIEEDRNAIL